VEATAPEPAAVLASGGSVVVEVGLEALLQVGVVQVVVGGSGGREGEAEHRSQHAQGQEFVHLEYKADAVLLRTR